MAQEFVVGEIYKTNTLIPDEYETIPPGALLRMVRPARGLCELTSLDGERKFTVPPGNLVAATPAEIEDGGPVIPPPSHWLDQVFYEPPE